MKIRLYYQIVDHGDGSYGLHIHKSQAELDEAERLEEDRFGYVVDEGYDAYDIETDDYEVVE